MPLGVARQEAPGLGERNVLADRGHDVLQPAAARGVVEGVVGGQKRRAAGFGEPRGAGHAALVAAVLGGSDGKTRRPRKGGAEPRQHGREPFCGGFHRGAVAAEPGRGDGGKVQPLAPFEKVG